MNPPCASPRPLPLPCARGACSPLTFISSFSQVFRSVSDQGMGCGNKSGLFVVFYHLMMANHRLLDCSHGNGSGFQHPAPLRTALAPSRKELEMSVRDNTLAGDSCRMAAPASCCKVSWCKALACSWAPTAACPPCSEPAARGAAWRLGSWGCIPPPLAPALLHRGGHGHGPCRRGSSALPRGGKPRLRRPEVKPRLRKTAKPGRGEACDGSWSIP